MDRNAYQILINWKKSKRRKPLVIKGARQVGKTWLMRKFAENEYENHIYISFKQDKEASEIFNDTTDTKSLIERISIIKGTPIIAGKTLLIFDEIQDCPNAVSSLKFFNESANEHHIISAGSLLGTYLARQTSFPVGKVNILNMYPFTFAEFLGAIDEAMHKYYLSINSQKDYLPALHNRMMELYRKYLIIGGMPECVKSWNDNRDPEEITVIQKELANIYEHDFAQHNSKIPAEKILHVFRNIITQLAKENNEKFVYSVLRPGARAKDFESAIEWLITSGIGLKVNNLSMSKYPLNAYNQSNVFKLFLLDVGLTKYMAGLTNDSIILNSDFSFKGPLNESFVLQQLVPQLDFMPNYFSFDREKEIDFVVQTKNGEIVPIEVKSGSGKRAISFKQYIEKFNPETAVRLSSNGYVKDGKVTNIPLYLASKLLDLI
jgi:predicted AAA+ superfamily ATPase